MTQRRFPPPWRLTELEESFVIEDGNGQALASIYFEDKEPRREIMRRLTKDEARRIAKGIVRLPELMKKQTQ